MRMFKFRLQTLLDQRKAKEDRILGELGKLRGEEAAEERVLASLRDRLKSACASLERELAQSGGAEEINRWDEYAKATRDDIRVQELTLIAVRERVEAKRQELIKAMQERQVLESLRDKQEREYLLSIARAEQNELDDMASLRYARGM